MTEDNHWNEAPRPQSGSMRFQDPNTTTPREPTLAEQRARLKAIEDEKQQEAARLESESKAGTKRKVLGGAGVTVGLVGVVAAWYGVAAPDEVTAVCTTADGTIVDDRYCDDNYYNSHGGYHSGGFIFIPMGGGGYQQYRYNYGGTGTVGQPVQGGSFTKPSNADISTKSGKTVQRGGFGISGGVGKSGGS